MSKEQPILLTENETATAGPEQNHLFPAFLKLEELNILLIGGGNVGLEKLSAILNNAPATKITVVATHISDNIKQLARQYEGVSLQERPFVVADLEDRDLAFIAVNDKEISLAIREAAKDKKILVNVADTPDQCDFYLGSIVQKGNLKVAVSTNGKSPTAAKRIKEVLNQALPEELDEIILNLHTVRNKLNGNFANKVKILNEITKVLVESREKKKKSRVIKVAAYAGIVIALMLLGHLLFSYLPLTVVTGKVIALYQGLDAYFYWMLLTGFVAQIVAGSMGMGYGVICTTVLLALGISPPAISSSIHTAETFTSGLTAYSHYRYGNVNSKMVKMMLIPGIAGAIIGSILLSVYGHEYAKYIRPILAAYTLLIGVRILMNAFKRKKQAASKEKTNIPFLATIGGFIDAFGGGGWGPLMTGSIVKSGRTPKYVIGSVCVGKFFLTLAATITFFAAIGISHWPIIAGLFLGGIVAAPFSARLASKLPAKRMFIYVGVVIVICSLKILIDIF